MAFTQEWEFGVWDLYDHVGNQGSLRHYFNFVQRNSTKMKGDVVEVGVFRGKSTLSMGILLKKLDSNAKVYGYDSFEGFPGPNELDGSPLDDISHFRILFDKGTITEEHHSQVEALIEHLNALKRGSDRDNLSTSKNFSDCSDTEIMGKATALGLSNIRLIKGFFSETAFSDNLPKTIMCALLDCDLYDGYRRFLPIIWDRLEIGGCIFLDEYFSLKFPGPRVAVDEFCELKNIAPSRLVSRDGEFPRYCLIKD